MGELSANDDTSRITCSRCGSRRVRRSRARTRLEMLVRVFTPLHFHMCRDCGTRGWHLGAGKVPLRATGNRRVEAHRTNRRERALRRKVYTTVLLSIFLGVALGLGLHECDSKPTPPSTMEPLD